MALPAIAAAAAASGAGLRAILARALPRISSGVKDSNKLTALGARLGLRNPSVQKVMNVVSSNKLMTALALYELYGIGDEMLAELASADAEIYELVETFGFVPDSVNETDSVLDLGKFGEEFDLLADVISMDGGYLAFLKRRQAYSMPMDVIKLYATVAGMSRKLPM